MADDSVPLPFPNLKVPQWHYQMENIERMKDEASSSYWKAVEADGTSFAHLAWSDIDTHRDGSISSKNRFDPLGSCGKAG